MILFVFCLPHIASSQPLPRPPVIVGDLTNQIAAVGQDVTFTINVLPGVLKTSYQWTFGGRNIDGATNASLALTNITLNNAGVYQALVANGSGQRLSAEASLTIVSIEDQSASPGADVTLRVVGRLLSGQREIVWSQRGRELARGTALTLTLTNVALETHAGSYRAEVSQSGAGTAVLEARLDIDPTFTKVRDGQIVNEVGAHGGVAWGDYDDDGYLDLAVAIYLDNAVAAPNRIYRNNRDGTFSKLIDAPFSADVGGWFGPTWTDFDNDGRLDLFVTRDGNFPRLYRNEGAGRFSVVTNSNLRFVADARGGKWADFDADGWVDLLVPFGDGRRFEMYRNTGPGGFVRHQGFSVSTGGYFTAAAWSDFDNDGRPDFIVTDIETNRVGNLLYRNLGDGKFERITTGPVVTNRSDTAGLAWGDYNNDGWMDLFLATGTQNQSSDDSLYRNNGDGTFTLIHSEVPGTPVSDGGESWDCAWADYDNDGYLDLYVTNGGLDGGPLNGQRRRNFLYRNDRNGWFVKITTGSPVNDTATTSCSWGDYDNDGFLDLISTGHNLPAYLYRNNGNPNGWLKVRPVGTISNRSALGAKVRVLANVWGRPVWQMREVNGGNGYRSQNGLLPHFGLGDATNVQTLRIEWPSGLVQEMSDVRPRQSLTIEEPAVRVTSFPADTAVDPGTPIALTLDIGALQDPQVQWFRDQLPIPGATNVLFEIPATRPQDVGSYRAEILAAGSRIQTRPVAVRLVGVPAIVRQPIDQSISLGARVVLTLTASGTPPLRYQWFRNGTELAEPTPGFALAITNVSASDQGDYWVVVSNDRGSVTSAQVKVSVDERLRLLPGSPFGAGLGEGIAWGDPEGDGLVDVLVSKASPSRFELWRNLGDLRFESITNGITTSAKASGWGESGTWADLDGQSGLDFVASAAGVTTLFLNDGRSNFQQSGLAGAEAGQTVSRPAVADFDGDGWMDVAVPGEPFVLYRGQGGSRYTNYNANLPSVPRVVWHAVWGDADGDLDPDLFLAAPDLFDSRNGFVVHYRNDGKQGFGRAGVFPIQSETGGGGTPSSCNLADIDNDGDLDLLVGGWDGRNQYFANDGRGNFVPVLNDIFVQQYVGGARGLVVFDLDNDGWLDVFQPREGLGAGMYVNRGDGSFAALPLGSLTRETELVAGAWGDADNDGFAELVVARAAAAPAIYQVQPNGNHWLKLHVRGRISTPDAIGAKVRVTATIQGRSLQQLREIQTSGNPRSQDDIRPNFGLGDATNASVVRIEWPSGVVQEIRDVAANQILAVTEPDIVRPLASSVSVGGRVVLRATPGADASGLQWSRDGVDIPGATNTIHTIESASVTDGGRYAVRVTGADGGFFTSQARVEVDPAFVKIAGAGIIPNPSTTPAAELGAATGVSWGDYDSDGYIDVARTTSAPNGSRTRVYRNRGDGTFGEVTSGPITVPLDISTGCAWADADNDGFLDLLVFGPSGPTRIYRGGRDGSLTPWVTGGFQSSPRFGAWLDLNTDGWLDLITGSIAGFNSAVYRGSAAGTFLRQSLPPAFVARQGANGYAVADYDDDGDADVLALYAGSQPSALLRNQGDGTLVEVGLGEVGEETLATTSAAWGDYDNDGLPDLYIVTGGPGASRADDRLYRNLGQGTFERVGFGRTGTPGNDGGDGMDASWADYDNDGFLDLLVVNAGAGGNFLYRNLGNGTFERATSGSLVNDANGTGATWGDYDNDGFLDVFVGNVNYHNLYRNGGNSNAWLKVRLIGTKSNRAAIGAKVRVEATLRGRSMWQLREVNGGGTLPSQNGLLPHFGLGDATNVATLLVQWPSGVSQVFRGLAPRQTLTLTEREVVIEPAQLGRLDLGEPVTLTGTLAATTSEEIVRYQWLLNGHPIPGATNRIYSVPAVRFEDVGTYVFSAIIPAQAGGVAAHDVVSRPVELALDKPVAGQIAISPTFVPNAGVPVALTPAVSGREPLFYQWQKNGVELAGQTNRVLTFRPVTGADVGEYRVVVRNALGSDVSPVAYVQVDATFEKLTSPSDADARGGSWGDFDNDGDQDLFISDRGGLPNLVYFNDGRGQFSVGTSESVGHPAGPAAGSAKGSWGDYDNDGWLDLAVGGAVGAGDRPWLYRNLGRPGPWFEAVLGQALGDLASRGDGAPTWVDVDNDGKLELFHSPGLHNDDRGRLFERTPSGSWIAKDGGDLTRDLREGLGASWSDYDNDGLADVLIGNWWPAGETVATRRTPVSLYRNEGKGRFTRVEPAGFSGLQGVVGGAWGDYDNDGDMDLFLPTWVGSRSRLLRNSGDGTFANVSTSGTTPTGEGAFAGAWGDYDNDGFLDLFVARMNQGVVGADPTRAPLSSNRLYRNRGDGTFVQIQTGNLVVEQAHYNSAVWADIDGDGFLDLFSATRGQDTPDVLYRNGGVRSGNSNAWSILELRGRQANSLGIGAKVRVKARYAGAERWQMREVFGGDGYLGGPPLYAHFGLGDAAVIDTIRIEWPSGMVQELHGQAVKRYQTVEEPDLSLRVDVERPNPGDTVTLTAPTFIGAGYQWARNGEDLPGATNAVLAIAGFGLAHEGAYQVLVKSQGDPVAGTFGGWSRSLAIELGGKPRILLNRFLTASSVSLGAEVRLTVTLSADTAPSQLQFEWQRHGTNIPTEILPTAVERTLIIPAATLGDGGEYRVRVTNDRGSVLGEALTLTIDPSFAIVRAGAMVTERGWSGGLSWGDYDNDGWLDLVAGQVPMAGGGGHRLYRNKGDGSFELLPSPTTDPRVGGNREDYAEREGVAWGDYDNDGLLDLFVANFLGQNWLYHNEGAGSFKLVEREFHAFSSGGTGASWSDVDNDGWLDLFVPVASGGIRLYRNTATNGFVRIPELPLPSDTRFMLGSAWSDLNQDGLPDLAVANWELGPNIVALNLGSGVFTNLVGDPVTANNGSRSVGVAWGDYDNDGLPDLFVSNGGEGGAGNTRGEVNQLYRNRGAAGFERITSEQPGTPVNDAGEWWDCAWADYDNDGFLDLYVAHGGTTFQGFDPNEKNALYRNLGDGTFSKVLTGSLVNDPGSQYCTWGDYDNDGFVDLVVGGQATPLRLYRNSGNTHGWVKVKPVGTRSNRAAIGAKVRVLATIGGREMWQLREVSGGSGFRGQNGLLPLFGLGDATNIQTLRVEWPSGIVQEYRDIAPRTSLTVIETVVEAVASAPAVLPGEAVTFRYAGPTNGVTLQWTLNGTNVAGATGGTLEVPAASLMDVGDYRVVATMDDTVGGSGLFTTTSKPVRFDLAGKPVVGGLRLAGFVLPSVSVGEFVRILSSVSGAQPLAFQWQFNGQDIPTNANPTASRQILQVPNASVAASGIYRLKVSNASGEALSAPFEIGVDPRFSRVLSGDVATSTIETITGNWVDYDNDGWLDLWTMGGWNDGNLRGSTTAQLYRNDGAGRLLLQGTNSLSRQSVGIWTAQWADFDNDGDTDVWQANHDSLMSNLYVNQGGGNFLRQPANRTLVPNIRISVNSSIGTWVDFDGDGLVDVMAGHYAPAGSSITPDTLLFNQGDGTFLSVTNSPTSLLRSAEEGLSFVDLNGDTYPDLFTGESIAQGQTLAWYGDGRGGFTPQRDHPLVLSGENYSGQVFADIDNDGDPDLFLISNAAARIGLNLGGGRFEWVPARGVGIASVGFGYSVFADLDNDADLDLVITQGVEGTPAQIKRSQMFLNDGAGRFEEVLTGTPVSLEPGGYAYQPSSGDFTGDGYPDLFVGGGVSTPPKVYINRHREVFAEQGKTNHWLVIRLKGVVSNGSGIGARVYVTAQIGGREVRQFRQVAGQMMWPNLEVHFGLGDAVVADTIRIEWPSGIVQELRDVAVDRNMTIEEEFKGPLLSRPALLADGSSEFSLVGRRGKSYRVDVSTDFLRWEAVRTVAITNATRVWLTVPVGAGGGARFYRAIEE